MRSKEPKSLSYKPENQYNAIIDNTKSNAARRALLNAAWMPTNEYKELDICTD